MKKVVSYSPVRVSICIPTYNRSACLRELLVSIEQQQRPGLEVVVANDASPDNTSEIMVEFKSRIHQYRLITHANNQGLDRNYQAVAQAATGEFIWMMGDDDRIEPGGVDTVFQLLEQWPHVVGLTLGVLDYDSQLQQPTGLPYMPPAQLTHGVAELFTLIPQSLGFMSALVIRRKSWLRVIKNDPVDQFQNLYSQVYVIGRAVGASGEWGIVPDVCVAFRSNNDQFQKQMGWYPRLETDVLAYTAIGSALLGGGSAQRIMAGKILETHVVARLRNGKLAGITYLEAIKACSLLLRQYYGHRQCWTVALPTLILPSPVLRAAKKMYQRFYPNSGRARARAVVAGHGGVSS